jgi:hypothetical protein
MTTLETEAIDDAPWKKFAPEGFEGLSPDEYAEANRRNIALCVGRYELTDPDVKSARETLEENLRTYGSVDPQEYLVEHIGERIGRYVTSFNLDGTARNVPNP